MRLLVEIEILFFATIKKESFEKMAKYHPKRLVISLNQQFCYFASLYRHPLTTLENYIIPGNKTRVTQNVKYILFM